MGQLISTIVSVLVLLIVPLGVVQIHTVIQMENELLELSLASVKFISNRGGINDADVIKAVRAFVSQELSSKAYRLDEQTVVLDMVRTKGFHPVLWSHEDEFRLSMQVPYPFITRLFNDWQRPLQVSRNGTINIMDYDL